MDNNIFGKSCMGAIGIWIIGSGVAFNFMLLAVLLGGYKIVLVAPEWYLNFLRWLGFTIVFVK